MQEAFEASSPVGCELVVRVGQQGFESNKESMASSDTPGSTTLASLVSAYPLYWYLW